MPPVGQERISAENAALITHFMFSLKVPSTWDSYGVKAMLISLIVLILLAASELQTSLNFSSGQTNRIR